MILMTWLAVCLRPFTRSAENATRLYRLSSRLPQPVHRAIVKGALGRIQIKYLDRGKEAPSRHRRALRPLLRQYGDNAVRRSRERVIFGGIAALARLYAHGGARGQSIVVRIVRDAPITERQQAMLVDLLSKEVRKSSLNHRFDVGGASCISLAALADSGQMKPATELERAGKAIRDAGIVHVFFEPGTPFPAWLTPHDFPEVHVYVYSFQDTTAEIEVAGWQDRARQMSLRDQFRDISTEGEDLYNYCHRTAQNVVKAVHGAGWRGRARPLPEGLDDVLAVSLSDQLSHRLSLLYCVRAAMAQIPTREPVVLSLQSEKFFADAFGILPIKRRLDTTFVTVANRVASKLIQFWLSVREQLWRGGVEMADQHDVIPLRRTLRVPDEERDRVLGDALMENVSLAQRLGRRTAESQLAQLAPGRSILVAYASSMPAYRTAVLDLIEGAVRNHEGNVVALCAELSSDLSMAQAMQQKPATANVPLYDLSNIRTVNREMLDKGAIAAIRSIFLEDPQTSLSHNGLAVEPVITRAVEDFFQQRYFYGIAGFMAGQSYGSMRPDTTCFCLPTRQSPLRAFATGLLSVENGPTVIDVQALNLLRHPKYLPPVAHYSTVIDSFNFNLYTEYFGVPADRVIVTGTPHNDHFLLNARAIMKRIESKPEAKNRRFKQHILFISQLQPEDRVGPIVDAIASHLQNQPDACLTIRLHPREGDARREMYTRRIGTMNIRDRLHFSHGETGTEALVSADIVVTIYSNMAREAAMIGKPVIICRFPGFEPPLLLDKEGLGQLSSNPTKLVAMLQEHYRATQRIEGTVSAYFQNNPHLMEANSAERILALASSLRPELTDGTAHGPAPEENSPREISPIFENDPDTIHVLMEAGIPHHELPFVCRLDQRVDYHSVTLRPWPGMAAAASVSNPNEFSEQRAAFERGVADANAMAYEMADTVIDYMGETELRQLLGRVRSALWLFFRQPLIRAAIEQRMAEQVLRECEGPLLIAARSRDYLDWLCARVPEERRERTKVLLLDPGELDPVVLDIAEYEGRKQEAEAEPPSRKPLPKPMPRAQILSTFDDWYKALSFEWIDLPDDRPIVLFATDWRLKTVPPTMRPVLANLLAEGVGVLAINQSVDEALTLSRELEEMAGDTGWMYAINPTRFASQIAMPSGRRIKAFSRQLSDDCAARLAERASPALLATVRHVADAYARTGLLRTVATAGIARHALERTASGVIACPGRQWHAETAMAIADQMGRWTATVQNAYMTQGYTYTRPSGQWITAIDSWSRDLFVEHYGIPSDRVEVTSTPRFDYIAGIARQSRTEAAERIGIDPDSKLVLYAAQVGFDAEAVAVTEALCTIAASEPLTVVIKLHPRTSAAVEAQLRHLIDELAPAHEVKVDLGGRLEDFLGAADVVVTMFSNVGIEAAVAKKPLVIHKPSETPLPLPLDLMEIGVTARNGEELKSAVQHLLADGPERDRVLAMQARFGEQNPALAEGRSERILTDRILSALREGVADLSMSDTESKDGAIAAR
jgi:CDP-glycerol glycerophosphotransferase (TagB/SpsB family)